MGRSHEINAACMVDTSQVALDAFSLLDSDLVFGASPLLAGYHEQRLSTALTIVDDMKSGKDAAVIDARYWP